MDTWENLQARLFHLGWLGEELPAVVAAPGGAWLFGQITREAQTVAGIAADYLAEYERASLTGTHGTASAGKAPDPTNHGDKPDSRRERTGGGAA